MKQRKRNKHSGRTNRESGDGERKPLQKWIWIIAHSLTNYNNFELLIVFLFLYFSVLLSLLANVLFFVWITAKSLAKN